MRGRKAEITSLDGALSQAPKAPSWLPAHGKAEWRRVVPQLVADRKIAAHELSTVESYCVAVARMREAEAALQKHGLTFETGNGPKRRPETTILKESIEAARRLAAELGLTPASRTKNKGGAVGNDEDDDLGDI
ncbi:MULTISPECIES: phage terminase small subunit P27 family [unclassified Mesorhizobium]|uniref:phage terminase small subunit P27 family n=1 Tax=unclassified Mesorhizobium TaxID=325217 RepID=UPI001092A50F|nr:MULTISPECIES: phage terminase small subunit P27 family [unclassified Mesorhizobium]TGP88931.1 phage terminase small subunit P27 family [Mesorhizobium sp. M8A.F.Ca.ET.218.01.1.1]TGT16091.1 phage terminase small subunit P27 family [Mesorhizobium sp. M8A.F.Ca.ET.213.01.1.1]